MTAPTARQPGPFGFRRVPSHLKSGIHYGYPICCVLHFCWDNALGRAAGMTRWKQIRHERSGPAYVPCGLFHGGGSPLSIVMRVRRILSFEIALLQRTERGRKWRGLASHGGTLYQVSTNCDRQQAADKGTVESLWWSEHV